VLAGFNATATSVLASLLNAGSAIFCAKVPGTGSNGCVLVFLLLIMLYLLLAFAYLCESLLLHLCWFPRPALL
jgi:hypothetical protein